MEAETPVSTQQVAEQAPEKRGESQQGRDILEKTGAVVVCIVCGCSGCFINPFQPMR
jgi:hypothetical protein